MPHPHLARSGRQHCSCAARQEGLLIVCTFYQTVGVDYFLSSFYKYQYCYWSNLFIIPIPFTAIQLERAARRGRPPEAGTVKFVELDGKLGLGHNHINHSPQIPSLVRSASYIALVVTLNTFCSPGASRNQEFTMQHSISTYCQLTKADQHLALKDLVTF